VTFGNLPQTIRWPQLKAILLERCGPIEHSRLFNDESDDDGSRRCVVNFETTDAVDAAVKLMGIELLPDHPVKVDFNERRGPWEWLPEPKEGEDANQKSGKIKKVQDEPIETAQQAAERRLKIPRIAPPEMRAYCQQVTFARHLDLCANLRLFVVVLIRAVRHPLLACLLVSVDHAGVEQVRLRAVGQAKILPRPAEGH
jgi:hypothetical protein